MDQPYRPAGYCPRCGYPLDAAPCPECGAAFAKPATRGRWQWRTVRRVAVAVGAAVALLIALRFIVPLVFYEWWPIEHVAHLANGRGWLAKVAQDAWMRRFERCAAQAAERAAWIEDEACELGDHPWGGCYVGQDNVKLALSPSEGFVFQRFDCDGYPRMTQFGGVQQVNDTTLKLPPEVPAALATVYPDLFRLPPNELLIVRWDSDVYLVPTDRMRDFCLSANTGRSSEAFAPVESQRTTPWPQGAPVVPREYRELILPAPLSAEVIEVGDISSAPANSEFVGWRASATLNVGRRNGISPGVRFFSREHPRLSGDAMTVAEGTTRAAITWLSHVGDCRPLPLTRGSTLSTRDPAADRPFDPGPHDYLE